MSVAASRSDAIIDRLLYIHPKGIDLKLDRIEPHYLWGQIHVEYVYMTWQLYGQDILMPTTATRLVDGDEEVTRTLIDVSLGEKTPRAPQGREHRNIAVIRSRLPG